MRKDGEEKAPSRRREQAEVRREQLLQAALKLFAANGVGSTSIKDIAREAGITEGLIYHYFESKEELLREVVTRFEPTTVMSTMEEKLRDVPIREALTALCHGLLNLYETRREFFVLVVTEVQRNPEFRPVIAKLIGDGMESARQFMLQRIESGELRPHDPIAPIRMLQGALFFYFLMQSRLSPPLPALDRNQLITQMVDVALTGVLADDTERVLANDTETSKEETR